MAVAGSRTSKRRRVSNAMGWWLWGAIGASVALHVAVVYGPFLQRAFGTVALSGSDWLFCAAVASSVLWVREGSKALTRHRS